MPKREMPSENASGAENQQETLRLQEMAKAGLTVMKNVSDNMRKRLEAGDLTRDQLEAIPIFSQTLTRWLEDIGLWTEIVDLIEKRDSSETTN